MTDTEQSTGESASDWKRDSIWHFNNWLLALILLIFTGAAYFYGDWHKPVKALTCDVVTVGPLVSVEDDINKRIQVVFDHKPVPNVKFAVIKVANAGNVPIDESDFKRPLTLQFGGSETSNILTAQLLNTHPNNIGATYKVSGNTLTLNPLLLNGGDNITLKVIYTGEGNSVNVDARIKDIPELTGTDPEKEGRTNAQKAFLFAFFPTVVIGLYVLISNRLRSRSIERRLANDPAYLRAYLSSKKISQSTLTDEELATIQAHFRASLKKK